MDCSLLGSSVHGILQARILEWVVLLCKIQGILQTQGLNLGFLHCRQTLYCLNHQESLATLYGSNLFCCCCLVPQLCLTLATPWIVAHQTPLSIEFPSQEYRSGLPFSSLGIFLTQGLNSSLLLDRLILYH